MSFDLFSLTGKRALVTGGSRGIGAGMAEGLVRAGATVMIASRTSSESEATASRLSQIGPCEPLTADLSSEQGARALADQVLSRTDRLHILINNAGMTWHAPIEEHDDAGLDLIWAVNVKAPLHLVRFLLPALRAAATAEDHARVINVGSIDGLVTSSNTGYAYAATKAALIHLTRYLARDLARDHIAVNGIAPGAFRTVMLGYMLDDPKAHQELLADIPMRRVADPIEMAGTAVYLSSRASSYVTGEVLVVDGGYTAARVQND
jgi:NAD(P)-dependent dehydrogenase (short-subunit alcohol dehydrogenase family)